VRLGSPAVYAAELRAAAGLPARADADDEFSRRMAARLAASRLGQVVRRDVDRLNSSSAYRGLRSFLPELRPAWWVLRAWAALQVLAALTSHDPGWHLVPNVGDHPALGVALLIPAVIASVRIGRQPPSWTRRRLLPLANAALAVGALVAAVNVNTGQYAAPRYDEFINANQQYGGALSGPYGTITNIYPHAADGAPLEHVRLYDQEGRPVIAGSDGPPVCHQYRLPDGRLVREPAHGRCGEEPSNVFPHREPIYDPATGAVIGERPRPIVIPPGASASPTPTVTPSPAPSAVTGLSASPSPSASPSTASSASGKPSPSGSPHSTASVSTSPAPTGRR
jgi:hypothetical protein